VEGKLTATLESLKHDYKQMLLIRRFEEEAARAYAQGKIGGFLHLYIGQESIAVAAASLLKDGDTVFQTYRDHGTALAMGMSPEAAMAELFGKDTGCSRGMGGSMHFFDVENGFLGGWGIVGGHIALAAGAAFRSKYLELDHVTLCFFGEGATNIGGFHEAMSLAGLWKLPAVFICENNQYAMGTPMSRTSPLSDLSVKAAGYGMPGDRFEGYDVEVVREHLGEAIERARKGEGPTFIEIETYRFRGHSMSDPGKYRTSEELEERKKKDPVRIVHDRLREAGADDEALEAIEDEAFEAIEAAVKHAGEAPPAKEEVMMSTVTVEEF
jgi:pyruvate dehydrogenase E1 component alpha subunit